MPIPPFQANGTLPPGTYPATLVEIITAFPPSSQERQELNQALSDIVVALGKLKQLAPDMVVYLNGSFVTRKPSPNDLDMLILTDYLDEDQIKAFIQQEAPIAALALDLYAEHRTGGASARILAVFSFTRTNRPKGVIILDF